MFSGCRRCDKVSVSSNNPSHNLNKGTDNVSSAVSKDPAAKQTRFKRNVNIPSPNEVRRGGTVDCSIYTISQIEGQQFIRPSMGSSILTNNPSTQTDPLTENQGVNIKLRSRQMRLEPAKPVLPCRGKYQRAIKTTEELLPMTESEQQQPDLVVQEKSVEEESKVFVTKVPQDIDQLLSYMQQKIEQLVYENIRVILRAEKAINYCVYCRKRHNVAVCELRECLYQVDKMNNYEFCSFVKVLIAD